jgi:hypothetical protein
VVTPGEISGERRPADVHLIQAPSKRGAAGRRGTVPGEDDIMYRSVVESEQQGSERRRLWRWGEGILVAAVVVVGVTYLFGLLTF